MPETIILVGDVRERIKDIPDDTVHCCVTSPPYFSLRDYGTGGEWQGGDPECTHSRTNERAKVPQGVQGRVEREAGQKEAKSLHLGKERPSLVAPPDVHNRYPSAGKAMGDGRFVCTKCGAVRIDKQIGLETTPENYVEAMVEVCREIKRVLRPDGTFWLNIGDSYASTGGDPDRLLRNHVRPYGDIKPKDKIGIPWMVVFALRKDGWYWRSQVEWCKKAPMPESVVDRPTNAHEPIFLLTKSPNYHFDGYAAEDLSVSDHDAGNGFQRPQRLKFQNADGTPRGSPESWTTTLYRNIRSFWVLGPERAPDFHFATFVSEIPRRCILSSLGKKGVCAQCGAPWKRITKTEVLDRDKTPRPLTKTAREGQANNSVGSDTWGHKIVHKSLGWEPTCECDCGKTISGTVLDPFLGSGTTALVANQLGHNCIGIELSESNARQAKQRIEKEAGRFFGNKVEIDFGNTAEQQVG